MNTTTAEADSVLPIYAVTDRRTDTGLTRIVAEFVDPQIATKAAELLRAVGAQAEVVLITDVRD